MERWMRVQTSRAKIAESHCLFHTGQERKVRGRIHKLGEHDKGHRRIPFVGGIWKKAL
jgi:hypothetical protein